MVKSGRFAVSWTVGGILLLQFLTVPYLASIDKGGKLFLFAFVVLPSAVVFFRTATTIKISKVLGGCVLLCAIFFVSAGQAFRPASAYVQVAILAVYILFLLLMTHWAAALPRLREALIDAVLFFGLIAAVLGLTNMSIPSSSGRRSCRC